MGRLSCDKNLAKNKEICYAYDTLSRVVLKKVIDLSDNSETSESFHYNPAGNICMANGNESYEYDANNRLLRCNGRYLGYDEDGNMFISELGNFTFDSSNRLTYDGTTYFAYDVEGSRFGAISWTLHNTDKYTYNTNARLSQLIMHEHNNVITKYVYGLGLISEETGTDFKVYHYDYRGSTVALTDESGNVTDTYSYDTYGKMLEHEGTSTTQFLYNGRDGVITEYSGLIYMRARYYSPTLRRFVNADKVHGDITNSLTLNRYSFCNGDPVNGVDPLGLSRESGDVSTGKFNRDAFGNGDVNRLVTCTSENAANNSAWDKFKTKDGNYALYDNWRHRQEGVFHEQAFVISFRQPKHGVVGSSESWIVLPDDNDCWIYANMASGVVEFDLLKGGWEFGNLNIDMLDVVHAELGVELTLTKIECQAFVSLWSPSVSYDFGDFSIDLSAEVCSYGFGFKFGADGFKISVPGIFGFSIGFTY